MKPIPFNTEMVLALLGNRKTVTRRVVKPQPRCDAPRDCGCVYWKFSGEADAISCKRCLHFEISAPPYRPGDILYVQETWRIWKAHRYDADAHIEFKAGGDGVVLRFSHGGTDSIDRNDYDTFIGKWGVDGKWHPPVHMPKKAARIFLRVTDVQVERLQDITPKQAAAEGVGNLFLEDIGYSEKDYGNPVDEEYGLAKEQFAWLWDSTIKPADRALYGWDANPWVWVIEFERISNISGKVKD